jgi:DNA-dependent protein kinase catalytic subunit
MIEDHMNDGRGVAKGRATNVMRKWLNSLNPDVSIQDQHVHALGVSRQEVVNNFENVCAKFPKYVLRDSFKSKCSTPEIFLNRRANFIKSYASLCIASYILGIGDRHLENFLISLNSGCIYGIDFGIAFDSGLHLGIPELVPFRLTGQMLELIEPYSLKGHMKHALYALRRNQNLILDTCEIFIKEPLLEWVKEAQHQNFSNEEKEQDSLVMIHKPIDHKEKIEWYPQKKIDRMKDKLEGK